jgi:hypothetical protein
MTRFHEGQEVEVLRAAYRPPGRWHDVEGERRPVRDTIALSDDPPSGRPVRFQQAML